jgi:hypothetical protein
MHFSHILNPSLVRIFNVYGEDLLQKQQRVNVLISPFFASLNTALDHKSYYIASNFIKHITPKSDAVGRYTMNSGKALNFGMKMTSANELCCQRSAGFFCYVDILIVPKAHTKWLFSILKIFQ